MRLLNKCTRNIKVKKYVIPKTNNNNNKGIGNICKKLKTEINHIIPIKIFNDKSLINFFFF